MEKPSVSIIVPVYNVEAFVSDCISSVMRQTYTGRMECIVVDDCGQDASMAIVERMVADYKGPVSFKILHHTHNRGLSAARNTGTDAATGEYIFFLDSDDEITHDSIDMLTRPLEVEKFDVVAGFVEYILVRSPEKYMRTHGPQELNIAEDILLRPPMILRSYQKRWAVVAWNRLYRTAFIRRHHLHFKEGLLYEDNLWSFQIACLASSLYLVSHGTYIHKFRKGSIMDLGTKKEHAESWITILEEMRSFVDAYHIETPDVFPLFNSAFNGILDYYAFSKKEYGSVYRRLRPYVKASFSTVVRSNRLSIKGYLRDLHYFLPSRIAPDWQRNSYLRARALYERVYHFKQAIVLNLCPKFFISRNWKRVMGYAIDWKNPRDLNEKIQWLLVNSDTSVWTRLADKYMVREHVEGKGLGHLLVPLYGVWRRPGMIDYDALPNKFVLKCNHDCGSIITVDKTNAELNREVINNLLNDRLLRNYGDNGELHYRGIPRRVIAEKYLEMTEEERAFSSSHIDYKVWCINGTPLYICCTYNRTKHSLLLDLYDKDWEPHPEYVQSTEHIQPGCHEIPRPKCLTEMLAAASILSKGFPEVRVDFYVSGETLYFGEMTFTSAGGMMKYFTPEFLRKMGELMTIEQ